MPSLSLLFSKNNNEIRDGTIAKNNTYDLRSALYPGQNQHIYFEKQDYKAYD